MQAFLHFYGIRVLAALAALMLAILPVYGQQTGIKLLEQSSTTATYEAQLEWRRSLAAHLPTRRIDDSSGVRLVQGAGEGVPWMSRLVQLGSGRSPSVRVLASDYETQDLEGRLSAQVHRLLRTHLSSDVAEIDRPGTMRGQRVGTLVIHPLTYNPTTKEIRRYRHLRVRIQGSEREVTTGPRAPSSSVQQTSQSVLASGRWFKIPVQREGIYRITASYLADSLGLSPEQIDPRQIGIYGNGGKPLPAPNAAPRPHDLIENPVYVSSDDDGAFEDNEYLLFYGKGTSGWEWTGPDSENGPSWTHYLHPGSNSNYYFLRLDQGNPARLAEAEGARSSGQSTVSQVQGRYFHEVDRVNLGSDGGSGLDWLGQQVTGTGGIQILSGNRLIGRAAGTATIRLRAALRSFHPAELAISLNGQVVEQLRPGTISETATGHLARVASTTMTSRINESGPFNLGLSLEGGGGSANGYLDWAEVFYPRQLVASSQFLRFSVPGDVSGDLTFQLQGFDDNPLVWDVTSHRTIGRLPVRPSEGHHLVSLHQPGGQRPRELIAFTTDSPQISIPPAGHRVENQNLHGINAVPEGVIVTPDTFRVYAEKLAEHRRSQGLAVNVVTRQAIYNEYSGGVPDMRAVRDYLRFLYEKGMENAEPRLQYVLLFGDGHVDMRNINDAPLSNWILPYETEETFLQIASYTSDDYFGLLDEDEGNWDWQGSQQTSSQRVDVGIGRIPVQTLPEAQRVVNKLIRYDQSVTQGQWRSNYTLVADDGPNGTADDRDLHTQNAEAVASVVDEELPSLNLNKIYAITYPAQVTTSGRRIPGAETDVRESIEGGTLLWNYTGHGSWEQLAAEHLFTVDDVDDLQNTRQPFVGITATCSFGHWDMPHRQSGAERLLLKAEGGAIAMLTSVRVVFTSSSLSSYNVGLNRALNRQMLTLTDDGHPRRLGDIMRLTKNTSAGAEGNNRKFNLLGDPMMRIGIPNHRIRITRMNGVPLSDTTVAIPALGEASFEGEVEQPRGGRASGFDGLAHVTIYDAPRTVSLPEERIRYLQNGNFDIRNEILFRGRVRVNSGTFTGQFIVPKDVSYRDKPGRISVYARTEDKAGLGSSEQFAIQGTAAEALNDQQGPELELYLGDTTFVSGGLTQPNPTLVAKVSDETGLNTVGAGVGHETLLVLDGNQEDAIDVSRYFESAIGSHRKGTIKYRLPEQEAGNHTLSLTVWDAANNPTKERLQYHVAESAQLTIRNVYNYPNPTSGPTRFVIEHNQPPGTPAEVEIRIFTVSGRPVRTLKRNYALPSGPLQIPWEGRDQDFDPLATGVYLYQVRLTVDRGTNNRQVAQRIERLAVIQ